MSNFYKTNINLFVRAKKHEEFSLRRRGTKTNSPPTHPPPFFVKSSSIIIAPLYTPSSVLKFRIL